MWLHDAGHTLVIPKSHVARLSDLSPTQGAALAKGLTDVARAMEKGTVFPPTNLSFPNHRTSSGLESSLCTNCGPCMLLFADIQVHFHIVPAPLDKSEPSVLSKWASSSQLSLLGRHDELCDDEGEQLSSIMRKYLPNAKL